LFGDSGAREISLGKERIHKIEIRDQHWAAWAGALTEMQTVKRLQLCNDSRQRAVNHSWGISLITSYVCTFPGRCISFVRY
jgi:hypothetical protein